jgi:subtilisin family serine protease
MTRTWIALVGLLTLLAWPAGADEVRPLGRPNIGRGATDALSRKLAQPLRGLVADFRDLGVTRESGAPSGAAERFSTPIMKVDDAGRVQVYVHLADTDPATLATLQTHGFQVEILNQQLRIAQGWVPVVSLETLAAEPAVLRVRLPDYATPDIGSVTSEGDAIHRCNVARGMGFSGTGIKVGVISDGVSGLAASQGSGDLGSVTVLSPGSGDEGTAMLEIVHDCATGAQLLFASGLSTLDFINSVNALVANGARIIVDDLSFHTVPYFEDGPVALNDRTAGNSALRVSSAGNRGLAHYQGLFTAGPNDPEVPGTRHLFSGSDSLLRFSVPANTNGTIFLQWADPFGASGNDYDLCVRQTSGPIVDCSTGVQDGNDDPIEVVTISCGPGPGCQADIEVTLFAGAARTLELFCPACTFLEFNNPADSIIGHKTVPEVLAVAAAGASTPTTIQPYSSRGPSTIFFPTTQVRNKPDVTGIDCVVTSRPGFIPFCGTSAAAPHVGAVAAILLQKNPGLSAAQLRDIVKASSVDLSTAGFDFASGFGRVDAVNGLPLVPIFVDVPSSHFARQYIEALYKAGVTGGCTTTPLQYCPDNSVTREQMAVFLLKADLGAGYTPPPCTTAPFPDVPCSNPFAAWIKDLVARGITSGCGGGLYCPGSPVTREQMAVFLLKTLNGASYTPPACTTATFSDVPCSSPFARWIYDLVSRGITAGCSAGLYCPTNPVTRAQMAIFLVKTFSIPL